MKSTARQRLYAGAVCCLLPFCAFLPLRALAEATNSMTVYRSVDADGVVSFSDAPHPSAVPIEVLPPRLPLREDVERANQQFEQQLALLEILETSRHARAKEDLERQRLNLDYVRTEAALQRARDAEQPQSDVQYFPLWSIGRWPGQGPWPGPRPWPKPPIDGHPTPPPSSPPMRAAFPR